MRTCVLVLLLATAGAGEATWIGYGGPEGSRVYPGTAPTAFDHTTGEGVLWETPLPSWGHGSPIAVDGKVFVLCETGPENLFPLLVCLDGASGEVLWRRELDHLPAITGDRAEQEELRRRLRALFDLESTIVRERVESGDKKRQPKSDEVWKKEYQALRDAMGLVRDGYKTGGYCTSYAAIGEAYATPVTDGESVYATTAWGGYACFGFDGELRWMTYSPGAKNTWNNRAPSPIIHGELLIHSSCGTHRAFDRATGALRWNHDIDFGSVATPAVITVDGRDVLLTPAGSAHLLPGGEPIEVEGWRDVGMQITVHPAERDVAYFCGSGEHCSWEKKGGGEPPYPPAALRFAFEGNELVATVLWHGEDVAAGIGKDRKQVLGGNAPWMLLHDGRFYHREGFIPDALTGAPLDTPRREKYSPKGVPKTHHLLAVCGGHVYGFDAGIGWPTSKRYEHLEKGPPTATLQVTTLDGKFVGDCVLQRKEPTEEQRAMHEYCTGHPRPWMEGRKVKFSYGYPFTFGDGRIYLRSLDSLIGVGGR